MASYGTIAVDHESEYGRDYVEVVVDEGDDLVDVHAEDSTAVVDLRFTLDETDSLINNLRAAYLVAQANSRGGD